MRRTVPIFYRALLLTAVNLLLRLAGTGFQVWLSRRIGAEGIGLLQLTLSVGSFALVAGMAGIRTATMYLTAEELGHRRPENTKWVLRGCLRYSLLFSCGAAFLLGAFAPRIADIWLSDVRTVPALYLLALSLPVSCMCGVMTGYFTAANRIGTLAAVEIGEQLLNMAATVTSLHFFAGSDPGRACVCVILGSSMGSCLTLSLLLILRRREHSPSGPRIPVARRLCTAALPLAAADNLRTGISTVENLMVPRRLALHPGTVSSLALFGMVSGMVFPVMMFPAAILYGLAELLIPELARCNAAGSRRRICYLVQRSLRICLLYGTLFGGLLYLLSDPLCRVLYREPAAGVYLKRFSLLIPMLYCDLITDAMIKGLGQQRASVRYNILTNTMDVILLFILLPLQGIPGYFASFLITHAINFALSIRRLLKITGQRIPLLPPALTLGSALTAAGLASTVPQPILRALCYLALLFSLWFLTQATTREDLRWLRGLIGGK